MRRSRAARREEETGLLRYFFGEKCEGRMSLAVFEKFLHDLHTELDKLEFQHYDPDNTVRRVSKLQQRSACTCSLAGREVCTSQLWQGHGLNL
jgi:hypothetical protein